MLTFKITYKPGYRVDLETQEMPDGIALEHTLRINFEPQDSRQPEDKINIGFIKKLTAPRGTPDAIVIDWIWSSFEEMERHEMSEWLRIDGARVAEPKHGR